MALATHTWTRPGFVIDTDPDRLDRATVHRYLAEESYWATGVPRATLDRAIDHSICFGLYDMTGPSNERLVGFGRVITDTAVFANLSDVFVLPEWQGQGLGVWLVDCVLQHPDLQGLRRFTLGTRDAHGLYERFGFAPHPSPASLLERHADIDALYA